MHTSERISDRTGCAQFTHSLRKVWQTVCAQFAHSFAHSFSPHFAVDTLRCTQPGGFPAYTFQRTHPGKHFPRTLCDGHYPLTLSTDNFRGHFATDTIRRHFTFFLTRTLRTLCAKYCPHYAHTPRALPRAFLSQTFPRTDQ